MSFSQFFFYTLLLFKIIDAGEVGDKCVPIDDFSDGTCTLVDKCDIAVRLIRNTGHHPFSRCGFQKLVEIVCCPSKDYVVKSTSKTVTKPIEKFGEVPPRVADIECQKIVNNSIPPLGLHIIGGDTVSAGEFPHMVALGYLRDGYEFLCGGSLISEYFVLTAAHCVDTLDQIKPSIARLGVIDIRGQTFNSESDVRIEYIKTHPDYNRRKKYHDLALIKLVQPVQTSMYVSPICLYTNDEDPTIQLTITGWGKTSNDRDLKSTELLKANVTIASRNQCQEHYSNWRKLPDGISKDQICAGDPQGLRDTCQGDSGGPLQGLTARDGQYRLVGVTSFGRGCGSPIPGVYTRISQYLNWLESEVWPTRSN